MTEAEFDYPSVPLMRYTAERSSWTNAAHIYGLEAVRRAAPASAILELIAAAAPEPTGTPFGKIAVGERFWFNTFKWEKVEPGYREENRLYGVVSNATYYDEAIGRRVHARIADHILVERLNDEARSPM